jgi:DNA polymerase-3 subunit delta
VTGEQLPQWILQRAKKKNIVLSTQAASWLAEQVEGNLLAAAQEIEKLTLLSGDKFDERSLDEIISNNARFDIFTLVDSALNGNAKRSLRIVNNLNEEDTEPTLVLWAITRELRTMADIIQQTQQGQPLASLFSKFRIWDKRQPGARAFIKRNTHMSCCDMLLAAAKIDRIIKGAESGKVWDELERLALKMAGSAII